MSRTRYGAVAGLLWGLVGQAAETAPAAAASPETAARPPFSFVVFGDNQCATANPTSGVPERRAVPAVVRDLKPTLVLHTGDLMDHGYDADAYTRFAEYYAPMLDAAPFFPTMGNHDAGRGAVLLYKRFLESLLRERNPRVLGDSYAREFEVLYEDDPTAYPQSFQDPRVREFQDRVPSGVSFRTFYAFRFRNAWFLSLEQGTRWWANTPRPWLREHLRQARATPGIDHVFVYLHHPLYCAAMWDGPPDPAHPENGEYMAPVRRLYEEVFREYDVTMVFAGHVHVYDHLVVPDDGRAWPTDPLPNTYPHDRQSVHYVVTGGGGGPLNPGSWRPQEPSMRYSQKRANVYHVVQVEVQGPTLRVTAHAVQGTGEKPQSTVLDAFTLAPPPAAAPR